MATDNPFAVLSYIVAPALLTNTTALLLMGTINRFGRAVDRARAVAERVLKEPETGDPALDRLLEAELGVCRRRVNIIRNAMTAFYTATACLALATLLSLAGALIAPVSSTLVLDLALGISAAFGVAGVCAIVFGSATLVVESRLGAQANLHETTYVQRLLEARRK
ncbi:MAG: DUF2721 domain-containing protein [Rhodospirillaceae bacterium]|nr:DUF2721 domain-containing protein [Rhodospirillaceae bacterium]